MVKDILENCKILEGEFHLINDQRKTTLQKLSIYIKELIDEKKLAEIIVICTHNSRRSHFGQIWLAIAAEYYQLTNIKTYSGGTESTAFHPNAVKAFTDLGLSISTNDSDLKNPVYEVNLGSKAPSFKVFSKEYSHSQNPNSGFIAVMVCDDADQNCPIVFGAKHRISLPYEDPKRYDETPVEAEQYLTTCKQIGREMLFVISLIKD